ncbi:hypothetical protein ACFXJ8_01400 [Nonomuraea sp. NPDC059194]|uniref:hypothetical protein n=1 Tax=Nonomuraea sp. NPDC059194 TaxID=3346764 RepID=UPI0036A9F783
MTTPVQAPGDQQLVDSASRRAIWLAIAALAMTFMLPLAGLVMAIFALVAGFRALPLLRGAGRSTGVVVGGIVVATISLLLSAAATAMQLYLMDEYSVYQECLKGAGTNSAKSACFAEFRDAAAAKLPPGVLDFLGTVG